MTFNVFWCAVLPYFRACSEGVPKWDGNIKSATLQYSVENQVFLPKLPFQEKMPSLVQSANISKGTERFEEWMTYCPITVSMTTHPARLTVALHTHCVSHSPERSPLSLLNLKPLLIDLYPFIQSWVVFVGTCSFFSKLSDLFSSVQSFLICLIFSSTDIFLSTDYIIY